MSGSGKAPEQSNFVQTCNLLSQFVKRKGSLRDLNLEIEGNIESLEAIVNPKSRYSASAPVALNSSTNKEKSGHPGTVSSVDINVEYASNSPSKETGAAKRKSAPLTMFYGGRVLIFDDFPEDKAKELVGMARKGNSQMSYGISSTNFQQRKSGKGGREGLPPRSQVSGAQNHVGISSNSCEEKKEAGAATSSSQEKEPSSINEANGSDMPIARRSSLHRFLEKRKDRAGERGPYQYEEQPPAASSSKANDELLELKL